MQMQPVPKFAPPQVDADVIVIGARPAGMAGAVVLAAAGLRVIVLDMQSAPGGQIYRGLEANLTDAPATNTLLAAFGPAYVAGATLIQQFRITRGIDFRPDHTVWELRCDGTVGWLQGDRAGYLRAPQIVLANGAMERPVPFAGWTLPGVMTAGAVQTLLKAGRMVPSGRVVQAGTGPLIFLLADQLRRLGVDIALIARTDSLRDQIRAAPKLRFAALSGILKGLGWLARLRMCSVPGLRGLSGISAVGQGRVQAVQIERGRQVSVLLWRKRRFDQGHEPWRLPRIFFAAVLCHGGSGHRHRFGRLPDRKPTARDTCGWSVASSGPPLPVACHPFCACAGSWQRRPCGLPCPRLGMSGNRC